jgi:NADH:ubiquinone oxidoreductase subunit 5 (subunit L)/multisubunit Na+/H+ antiporter MnhA subunit
VTALAAIGAAAGLALVGGLAALCFVRLVGIALLGAPRSEAAAAAHESPAAMTGPIVALAVACLAASLAAPALLSFQSALLGELGGANGGDLAAATVALAPVVGLDAALLAGLGLVGAVVWWRVVRRRPGPIAAETWGCGYAAPTARMQYTGRAFAELATSRFLPRWLDGTRRIRRPEGPFPTSASLAGESVDPLTRSVYEPILTRSGNRFSELRFFQQGNVHIYILYIVLTAILALAWAVAHDWWVS